MPSPSLMHTVFYFLLALVILVAFHEYGHFYACRRLGVKVLRFSIGIGGAVWRYKKTPEDTEFSIGLLPLGGYVKMVDEREGKVAPEDLPHAFNRQRVYVRAAIVAAGPVANFLLAVMLQWAVFMLGEVGTRPVLGPVVADSLGEQAGFAEGDEIVAVGGVPTPIWSVVMGELLGQVMGTEALRVEVRTAGGGQAMRILSIPPELSDDPGALHGRLGLRPFQPSLPPVVDTVVPGGAAEAAGLRPGDRVLAVDGAPVKDWQQWVGHIRANPGKPLMVKVERAGEELPLRMTPTAVDSPKGKIGQVGASSMVPPELLESMQAVYRLDALPALSTAIVKTWDYSVVTLKMIGHMLVGRASVDNLSGPVGIAQYAGQSASMGLVQFLQFLASVSVGLGVLNLLPIPVLDGGHLMFYFFEALRGRPIPERWQAAFQSLGIVILFSLMVFSFYLDLVRHAA